MHIVPSLLIITYIYILRGREEKKKKTITNAKIIAMSSVMHKIAGLGSLCSCAHCILRAYTSILCNNNNKYIEVYNIYMPLLLLERRVGRK